LREADRDGDGQVGFDEFTKTMKEMVRKSWLRIGDGSISPSKSVSPTKFSVYDENSSPLKTGQSPIKICNTPSPTKLKRDGQIISPERNPFK